MVQATQTKLPSRRGALRPTAKGPKPAREPQIANPLRTRLVPADSSGQKRNAAQTEKGRQRKARPYHCGQRSEGGPNIRTQRKHRPARRRNSSRSSLSAELWRVVLRTRTRKGVTVIAPRASPTHQVSQTTRKSCQLAKPELQMRQTPMVALMAEARKQARQTKRKTSLVL